MPTAPLICLIAALACANRADALDGGLCPVPMSRQGMLAGMDAAAMPPPSASPEEQTITSDVSADVVLRGAAPDRKPSP